MPDKVKILYDAVSKDYDVGSFDEFQVKLQDDTKRKAFYDGVGAEYELGDFNTFSTKIKKKEPTEVASTSGTQTSKRGFEPFQSPVDTKTPSVLTPKGKTEYQEQVKKEKDVLSSQLKSAKQAFATVQGEDVVRDIELYQQDPEAFRFKEDNTWLGNAIKQGLLQGEIANTLPTGGRVPTPEDLSLAADINYQMAGIPQSDAQKEYEKSGFGVFKNPLLGAQFLTETIASSLAALYESGKRTVPTATATGAGAGAFVGGIGAIAGAGLGVSAGLSVAGLNLSTSGDIMQSLKDSGVDITDKDALIKAFNDENKMSEIRTKALKYGVPILAFDMASAGIAGKLIGGAAGKSVARKIAAGFGEAGTQSILGSAGELAGQVASGKNVDWNEVALEGIASLATDAPDVAIGALTRDKASSSNKNIATQINKLGVEDGVTDAKINLDRDLNNGVITPKEYEEGILFVEKAVIANDKIPAEVQGDNREQSIELIAKKEDVVGEVQQLNEQKQKTDDSYHPIIDEQIKEKEKEIGDINKQVQELAKPTIDTEAQIAEEQTPKAEGSDVVGEDLTKKTDSDIENRMSEIETDRKLKEEFNSLETEMEKRERQSVFNIPLSEVGNSVDALMQKDKDKPNGFGSFISKPDAKQTKQVADRYLDADKLTDNELMQDFSDAVRGIPTTWYADGLKLRESIKEASKRGIDTKEMIDEVIKVYTESGYDIETAKSVVSNMLSPILKGAKSVNEKQIKQSPTQESEVTPTKKSIKQLEAENQSTLPKIPTNKVFSNEVEQPLREDRAKVDALIDAEADMTTELPTETVSVASIVPTQKNLTTTNLEEVKGVEEKVILLKKGDKYFIIDGHHRIANQILNGESMVDALVYEEGGKDATKTREIEQSNITEREGVTEQQQGKQKDRVNQEESVTESQTTPSNRNFISESREVEEVNFAKSEIEKGAISWDGDRFSPRPDLGIEWNDIRKGQKDILAGKDTVPARRLIKAINKAREEGGYTFMQGSGGIVNKMFVPISEAYETALTNENIAEITANEAELAKEYDEWFNNLSEEEKNQELNFTEDENIITSGESKENVSNQKDAKVAEGTKAEAKKPTRTLRDDQLTEKEYIDRYVTDNYDEELAKEDYRANKEASKSNIVFDGKNYWWNEPWEDIWFQLDKNGELTENQSNGKPNGRTMSSAEHDKIIANNKSIPVDKPTRTLAEIEKDQRQVLAKYHDALKEAGIYEQAKNEKANPNVVEKVKDRFKEEADALKAEKDALPKTPSIKSSFDSNIEALINPETGMSAVIKRLGEQIKPYQDAFMKRTGITIEGYRKLSGESKRKIDQQWRDSKEYADSEKSDTKSEPKESKGVQKQDTLEKPDLKLKFASSTELVNSKDPIGNREKHNEIKERFKALKNLINCL